MVQPRSTRPRAGNNAGKLRVPHPIPYQGSKRNLAPVVLEYFPASVDRLYEPFAGSAAVALAALEAGKAASVHLNDTLKPLMALWRRIVDWPEEISLAYAEIWNRQHRDPAAYYERVRAEFNRTGSPDRLLFLLARCVKSAVRFNADGEFNQSADRRRPGTRPGTMRQSILGASRLLRGRVRLSAVDYARVLGRATRDDLVYLDPPYQGTSGSRDTRYHRQLDLDRFVGEIRKLAERRVAFIISLDGRCGDRSYGKELPRELGLTRMELHAGRSSQSTLSGRSEHTYESLYLSPGLASGFRQGRGPATRGTAGKSREKLTS
jgi:DNA adenine methylase